MPLKHGFMCGLDLLAVGRIQIYLFFFTVDISH